MNEIYYVNILLLVLYTRATDQVKEKRQRRLIFVGINSKDVALKKTQYRGVI